MGKDKLTDKGAVTLDEAALDAAAGGIIAVKPADQTAAADDSIMKKLPGKRTPPTITL